MFLRLPAGKGQSCASCLVLEIGRQDSSGRLGSGHVGRIVGIQEMSIIGVSGFIVCPNRTVGGVGIADVVFFCLLDLTLL